MSILPAKDLPPMPTVQTATLIDEPPQTLGYAPNLTASVEQSLAHRTSRGLIWMVGQTLGSKLATTVGQIVLTWLLRPEDFGVMGLALTVSGIVGVVQQMGLDTVIIQRQATFRRWAPTVQWMALTSSLIAALAMIIAAPIGSAVYHSREVGRLVLILATAAPLNALCLVPQARLQSHFRFRAVSLLGITQSIGTLGLSILLARLNCGVYSFAVPLPIMAAIRAGALWWLSDEKMTGRFDWRRFRLVMKDARFLVGIGFFNAIVANGDNMTLGLLKSKATVGIYVFAFNLSTQTISLLTFNLASVLLPALSGLQADPDRLVRAFLRAARVVTLIGIPLCLLQAAAAGPLLRLFFAAKWSPAIPVLQILSLGMALCLMGGPTASLLQAQGRFAFFFGWTALSSLAFLGFIAVGVYFGGAISVAIAVASFYSIAGPLSLYLAITSNKGRWRDVWHIYGLPMLIGGISLGIPLILTQRILSHSRPADIAACFYLVTAGVALYLPLARLMAPAEFREVQTHVLQLLARLKKRA